MAKKKTNEEVQPELNTRFIQKLEDHYKTTQEIVRYSINRFDILIISLSSGGLGISIGLVKNLIPNLESANTTFLKLSWVLFATAIISNLISQVTSYFANKIELNITRNLIRKARGKLMIGNQDRFEKLNRCYNNWTNIFNGISLLTFIFAILNLVVFISQET